VTAAGELPGGSHAVGSQHPGAARVASSQYPGGAHLPGSRPGDACPSGDERLFDYLLRLADSPLVLAQRLCEWIGKGPVLEEELALTNVGLDMLGQARMWLAYAGEVEARFRPAGRDEDQLAFRRDAWEFRNLLLAEQPNGDYAHTLVRQFLFDHAQQLLLEGLSGSRDARIAAIAAKALKEVDYHVQRSDDWMVRLGDGTGESHARVQRALDALWMYAGEMFVTDALEAPLVTAGIAPDAAALRAPWLAAVDAVLAEATLTRPKSEFVQTGVRQGRHTEHLGHLLTGMQFLQRAYPEARW
jgi:ring-1,2-phenylacetyl-CoA epoxidase subunit PaaC